MDPKHPAVPPDKPAPEWQVAAANDPLVGTTIDHGKYTILGLLGKGGMSIVYKARHNAMDRIVAIKTLKMQMMSEPTIVRRFEREIKLLSKLDHPNVVTVYNCVMVQNQPYFVMDCLSGQSLQELLKAEGRLSPERAQQIFIQCCNAVEHAHRKGVMHRDIKPGNIMISPGSGGRDQVKVVDFGLARLVEDAQRLTQSGEIWGSPLYMSPEQASAQELDARSDIYSLGTVMFETLTGAPPFRGKNFMETMSMQVHTPTPPMKDVSPSAKIPQAFEDIVRKTLEKEPENRFQTMAAIKDSLIMAVPSAQVQAATPSANPNDPQSAIPTVVLKRPLVNGYNYQARKKGWSAKLLAAPLIALIIIAALAASFRSLFFAHEQSHSGVAAAGSAAPSNPGVAAISPAVAPNVSAPASTAATSTTPQAVSQDKPALRRPAMHQSTTAQTEKPAAKPFDQSNPETAHRQTVAPSTIPQRARTATRKHSRGNVWSQLKDLHSRNY